MNTLELVPMQRTDAERDVAFAFKRDALGPHILATWGWDEPLQRFMHAQRWGAKTFYRIVRGIATVGVVAIDEAEDHVRLGELYVGPAFQRQGVGSGVMRAVLHGAQAAGLPVRLECMKGNPALAFYERHGLQVVAESDSHFLLEKRPREIDAPAVLERVVFENDRGLHLVADHYRVESDAAVVMANDLRTHKRWRGRYPHLARELNAAGIAAFAFDYCGCGESEDDLLRTEGLERDLAAAVEEVRRLGYRQVALWGHGLLAYICIEARVPGIATMVLSAAATTSMTYNWQAEFGPEAIAELDESGSMLVPTYDPEVRATQLIDAGLLRDLSDVDQARRLGMLSCPVLLVNGDSQSSQAERARLEGNRQGVPLLPPGSELHVIAGANHSFAEHLDQLGAVGAAWLRRHLRGGAR